MKKCHRLYLMCGLFLWLATLYPSTQAQDGPGSAVRFDGVDDYVGVNGTNTISGSFTVELWAKPSHPTAPISLVGSFYPQYNGYRILLFDGHYIAADIGSGSSYITSFTAYMDYSVGTWYHIACVVTPTNSIIYVNGNPAGMRTYSSATPLLRDANHLLKVGANGTPFQPEYPFNGDIDEVRIWNVARSESEVGQNFNCTLLGNEPGLVLYYRFDAGSGLTATDSTGHNNTGTLVNGPTWVTSGAFTPPTVTTTPASDFTPNGVRLNGTVNPGCHATTTWFDWGTTTNYGSMTSSQSIGSSTTNLNVSQLLTNLIAGQIYHYRIVATNSLGLATGGDQAFTPFFVDIGAVLPGVQQSSVAWGDYDNNGYLDFLLTGRDNSGSPITRVYHNNGNGTFTDIAAGLPGVRLGSVAWGDFDNDSYVDILLSGYNDTIGGMCRVYRNNGNDTFTDIGAALPGLCRSSVAWGDFDNDGRLDILVTGSTDCGNGGATARVYRNNGNETFTDIGAGLTGVFLSSVACGDFNNDSYLDILVTGNTTSSGPSSQVYRNNGNLTFTNINAALEGIRDGSVVCSDFDNDGLEDLLLAGYRITSVTYGPFVALYHNNGDGAFTGGGTGLQSVFYSSAAGGDFDNDGRSDILLSGAQNDVIGYFSFGASRTYRNNGDSSFTDINAGLHGVVAGSVAWGDYDNNGRLDILLTGCDGGIFNCTNAVARIYRNVGPVTNTSPTASSGLLATTSGSNVAFSWNAATDVETPALALTYNLRVGTTPGGCNIVSPGSDPATGRRRLPAIGNAHHRLSTKLTNLPGGTYYWSVQSVDAAFAGSPFATEASFSIPLTPLESWRLAYFGTSVNSGNAADSADPDGDGMRNLDEFFAGTVPTNSVSAFRIIEVWPEDNDMLLTWMAVGGNRYAVQTTTGYSGGFSNDFLDLNPAIVAPGIGDTEVTVLHLGGVTNTPSRYYRIRLVP